MTQNIQQLTATGTYSDASTANITTQAAWSVSDTSIATIGAATGIVTIQNAGKIWGGDVGVTATLAPGTPGTASLLVIASDSGSAAPRMPQQDNHWVALGLSPWGAYGGLQEPSGSNPVLSGSAPYTLTANNAGGLGVQFAQGESAWTRNFVIISGSTVGMSLAAASGTANAPNPNQMSCAWLCYARVQPGVAAAHIMGYLTAGAYTLRIANQNLSHTGEFEFIGPNALIPGRNLTGPLSDTAIDRVQPFLLVYNFTTGDVIACTADSITVSASCPVPAGTGISGMGGAPSRTAASASYCYWATATGSIVEPLTDPATAASFLQSLGWTVSWATCPTDSGSIKCPFLPYHWTGLGLNPWTATYNMQDVSNPIVTVDTWPGISMNAWNMTALSIDQYRARTPGWNRSGLALSSLNDHRATVTTIYGPPPLFDPTGSIALLTYALLSGSAVSTTICGVGGPNQPVESFFGGSANMLPTVYCAGASVTGTNPITGDRVHPWLVVYDKTNSRVKFYTDLEAITGTFNATSIITSITASAGFGGVSQGRTATSGTYVYGAICTGTLAESLSDDGVASSFLKTLGWTVNW